MRYLIFSGLLLLPPTLLAKTYQVKEGEQLGQILRQEGYSPLWGKEGYVRKTQELNPTAIKAEGDFLLKNAKIKLPERQLQQTVAFKNSAPQVMQLKREEVAISAAPTFRIMQIDAQDKASGKEESIKNDLAPGLRISFEHKLKERMAYGAFFNTHRLDFNGPDGKNLKQGKKSFNEFGISANYDLGETSSWGIFLSLEERPLLLLKDSWQLERVVIPKLAISFSSLLLEKKYFHLSGSAGASLLAPMDHEEYYINTGYNIFTGLLGRYALADKIELSSGLSAEYSNQHSSLAKNLYSDFTFNLGITFITDAPKLEK